MKPVLYGLQPVLGATAGKWTHIIFPLAMTAVSRVFHTGNGKRLPARRDGQRIKRIPLIPRIGRPQEVEALSLRKTLNSLLDATHTIYCHTPRGWGCAV